MAGFGFSLGRLLRLSSSDELSKGLFRSRFKVFVELKGEPYSISVEGVDGLQIFSGCGVAFVVVQLGFGAAGSLGWVLAASGTVAVSGEVSGLLND